MLVKCLVLYKKVGRGFQWLVPCDENHCIVHYCCEQVRSDLCVPYNFVIPDDEPWPEEMIGIPLGEWTNIARAQEEVIKCLLGVPY